VSTESILRGLPKDARRLVKNAIAAGAILEPGGKHPRLVYNGRRVPIGRCNEWRHVKNLQSTIRHTLGLELER
jgi:hypothetical protein